MFIFVINYGIYCILGSYAFPVIGFGLFCQLINNK